MSFESFNTKQKKLVIAIYEETYKHSFFGNISVSIKSITSNSFIKIIPVFVGVIVVGYFIVSSQSTKLVQNVDASTAITSLFSEVRATFTSEQVSYNDISYLLNEIRNTKISTKDSSDLSKLDLLETRLNELQRMSLNTSNGSSIKFSSNSSMNSSIADTKSITSLEKLHSDILFVANLR